MPLIAPRTDSASVPLWTLALLLAACPPTVDTGSTATPTACSDPSEIEPESSFHVYYPGEERSGTENPILPADRYLVDDDGTLRVVLPDATGVLADALADMDGFPPFIPIFLPFSSSADPDTVTADRFLLFQWTEGGETADVQTLPFDLHLNEEEDHVTLLPAEPLAQGETFGVAVLSGIHTGGGRALAASPHYTCLVNGWDDPDYAVMAEPVRSARQALLDAGYDASDLVQLHTFRTATVHQRLQSVVEAVDALEPIGSLDAPLEATEADHTLADEVRALLPDGISGTSRTFSELAWYVQGTLEIPDTAPLLDGEEADTSEREEARFSLYLPEIGAGGTYPVVIYQHGIASCRETGLYLSDTFNGRGVILAALDAREHYQRYDPDTTDCGSYDYSLSFIDLTDVQGTSRRFALNTGDLWYFQRYLEQALPDLLAQVAESGGGSDTATSTGDPPETGAFHYLGHSLGGMLSALLVSALPEDRRDDESALVVSSSGGGLLFVALEGLYTEMMEEPLSEYAVVMFQEFETALALGEPIFHAPHLGLRTLVQEAIDDDTVPNLGTELFARQGALPLLEPVARSVDWLERDETPASGNWTGGLTGGVFQFDPANHNMLFSSESGDAELDERVQQQAATFVLEDRIEDAYAEDTGG